METIMVTREPEWNEDARARALALTYVEDSTCGSCGGDLHQTLIPGGVYDVDNETVCHSCAAMDLVRREDGAKHEKDSDKRGSFHYSDGRIYTVHQVGREERAHGG